MNNIVLTDDQKDALLQIKAFLLNPKQKEFILSGNSGSGKSTLVKFVVDNLTDFLKPTAVLLGEPLYLKPYLTATTNEAATILSNSSIMEVQTIHKFFKIRFNKNYKTGKLDMKTDNAPFYSNVLLIVDEASMCNTTIRALANDQTGSECKILYVGDNEQLDAVKSQCDIFTSGLPEAHLTTNIRQAGNEIAALGLRFRDAVLDGKMPVLDYKDSKYIKYVDGNEFSDLVDTKFSKKNYMGDSRILAYHNERVTEYNTHIRELQNGCSGFKNGEVLTTNNIITSGEDVIAKNNTSVAISNVNYGQFNGMNGHEMTVSCGEKSMKGFVPENPKQAKTMINKLARAKEWAQMFELQDKILDLRPRFASTVHKSQGSTLNEVFIDLNDIASGFGSVSSKARALYVGITRAKSKVYLYGSL
jgi:exodeoxyribonuclease-5